MRRLLVSLALITVLGLAALHLWPAPADESLQRLRQAGVLRVGLEAGFPPFEVIDEQGNFSGLDIELAQILANELGVQAHFDNLAYDTLYDALAARRVDVLISSIIPEPERTQDVSYSPPYFDAGLLLVVRREETGIAGPSDLAGRRLAVEAASAAEEIARRFATNVPNMAIMTFSEPQQALAALAQGRADAAISDPISLAAFQQRQGAKFTAVGSRLTSEPYVIVTRRQDRALTQEVARLLTKMEENGELDRLINKWLGSW